MALLQHSKKVCMHLYLWATIQASHSFLGLVIHKLYSDDIISSIDSIGKLLVFMLFYWRHEDTKFNRHSRFEGSRYSLLLVKCNICRLILHIFSYVSFDMVGWWARIEWQNGAFIQHNLSLYIFVTIICFTLDAICIRWQFLALPPHFFFFFFFFGCERSVCIYSSHCVCLDLFSLFIT